MNMLRTLLVLIGMMALAAPFAYLILYLVFKTTGCP
jgi:hypothetical protein